MYRDSGVRHDRFRSRGGDFNVAHASGLCPIRKRDARATFFHNLVANKIQISLLRFINHFLVGKRSLRRRIPIDHATTAIDQTFVVQIDKNLLHCPGIPIVERVSLTRPIA